MIEQITNANTNMILAYIFALLLIIALGILGLIAKVSEKNER